MIDFAALQMVPGELYEVHSRAANVSCDALAGISYAAMTNETDRRTFWDVLPAISTFLSSVVLGIVALMVNTSYAERQSNRAQKAQDQQRTLNKVQTLVAFMPHLSSSTPETRETALFGISALGYSDLAIKLATLHQAADPRAGRKVADTFMRYAPGSPEPAAEPASRQAAGSVAPAGIGWIYLGDYSDGH